MLVGFAGLGLPGLAGFPGELNIFLGGFLSASPWARVGTFLAIGSIVVAAVYVLRGVNAILHGPDKGEGYPDANWIDKTAILVLLFGIVAMGLLPNWLAARLDESLIPILNNLNRG